MDNAIEVLKKIKSPDRNDFDSRITVEIYVAIQKLIQWGEAYASAEKELKQIIPEGFYKAANQEKAKDMKIEMWVTEGKRQALVICASALALKNKRIEEWKSLFKNRAGESTSRQKRIYELESELATFKSWAKELEKTIDEWNVSVNTAWANGLIDENKKVKQELATLKAELESTNRLRKIEQGAWEETKKYQDENVKLKARIEELEAILKVREEINAITLDKYTKIYKAGMKVQQENTELKSQLSTLKERLSKEKLGISIREGIIKYHSQFPTLKLNTLKLEECIVKAIEKGKQL